MNIKPIETNYKGIKFRSKLEAQWAVFFDECDIEWEYEPQGYKLNNGQWYLPDFLLHGINYQNHYIDLYVEVKGVLNETDKNKVLSFSESAPILLVGSFPYTSTYSKIIEDIESKSNDSLFFNSKTVDGFNYSCILGMIENDSGFSECGLINLKYSWLINKDLTNEIYYNARNYRFDHRN